MTTPKFEKLVQEGIEKCRLGKYEEAISYFDQAEKLDTNHTLLYNRSKALYKLRRLDDALLDLNRLIDMQPENPEWHAERAVIFHYHSNKTMALKDLDTAAELDPNNGFRFASRAFIKDSYGDHQGALADYEKAIELDPEDAISLNNKGLVEEKLGYQDRAKTSFAAADRLVPNTGIDKTENSSSPSPVIKSGEDRDPTSGSMTLEHYISTLREVFSSKRGARSFLNYFFGKKEGS